MTDDIEQKFARLVAAAAPPERDPYFRLKVMEQREKARFKRQQLMSAGVAVGVLSFGAVILIVQPTSLLNPVVLAWGALSTLASLACALPLAARRF